MAVVPLHTSRVPSRTLEVIEEIAELLGGIPNHWQYFFDILPVKVFFPPVNSCSMICSRVISRSFRFIEMGIVRVLNSFCPRG